VTSHWVHSKIFRLALAFAMTLSASVAPPAHAASHDPAALALAELEGDAALAAGDVDDGHRHANGRPEQPNPSATPSTCKVTVPRSTSAPAANIESWPRLQATASTSSSCCPRGSSMTTIGPGWYRRSMRSLPNAIRYRAQSGDWAPCWRTTRWRIAKAGRTKSHCRRSVGCPARNAKDSEA
jgi:hypothetical protein